MCRTEENHLTVDRRIRLRLSPGQSIYLVAGTDTPMLCLEVVRQRLRLQPDDPLPDEVWLRLSRTRHKGSLLVRRSGAYFDVAVRLPELGHRSNNGSYLVTAFLAFVVEMSRFYPTQQPASEDKYPVYVSVRTCT